MVEIYLDGVGMASLLVDSAGNWSWSLPLNQSGTLTVLASDLAGNASLPSDAVRVDTFVPVANAVSTKVAYNSSDNLIPLSITSATANAVAIASPASHGTAIVNGTSIVYTPTRGYRGTDSLTYTASNANGTSAQAEITIAIGAPAATAPQITLSTLSDGAVTADVLLNVSGVIVASNGILSATLDGVALVVLPDGRFSYPVRLAKGSNTITLVATDQDGLSTTAVRTVTLDTSAPTLELSQPPDNAVLTISALRVGGRAIFPSPSTDTLASVRYMLNGGSPEAGTVTGDTFVFDVSLDAGLNTIEVIAKTMAGMTVHNKRTVNVSPDLSLSITTPESDMLLTGGGFRLKGTVVSDSAWARVTINVGGQSYTPTVSGGIFEQVLTLDSNQVWPVQITATDANGHTATVLRSLVKASTPDPAMFTMADAYRALEIANGLRAASADDLGKYDVAPMLNGASKGDGVIDVTDAQVILWLASGQAW